MHFVTHMCGIYSCEPNLRAGDQFQQIHMAKECRLVPKPLVLDQNHTSTSLFLLTHRRCNPDIPAAASGPWGMLRHRQDGAALQLFEEVGREEGGPPARRFLNLSAPQFTPAVEKLNPHLVQGTLQCTTANLKITPSQHGTHFVRSSEWKCPLPNWW